MKEINFISLFDGMGCGMIALQELGIKVGKYYSSEIDKFANKQTKLNFPNIIQLGDVIKWREWNIDWASIDLVLAGSPCQGFSFAGKQLAFDDPRSKLFFVFVEILNHVKKFNPDVKFLLENVNMKKDHLRVISEYVGVFPVNINSNLVSAQNRDRWYWTNIRTKKVGLFDELYVDVPQPKDRGILLKDILEQDVPEKYFVKSDSMLKFITDKWRLDKKYTQIDGEKSLPLMARMYARWCGDFVSIREVRSDEAKKVRKYTGSNNYRQKDIEIRDDGKVSALQTSLTIEHNITNGEVFRRLTTTECARLQTIPDWYKWECSDTQIYRMCGNGWTINVVKHILSFLVF